MDPPSIWPTLFPGGTPPVHTTVAATESTRAAWREAVARRAAFLVFENASFFKTPRAITRARALTANYDLIVHVASETRHRGRRLDAVCGAPSGELGGAARSAFSRQSLAPSNLLSYRDAGMLYSQISSARQNGRPGTRRPYMYRAATFVWPCSHRAIHSATQGPWRTRRRLFGGSATKCDARCVGVVRGTIVPSASANGRSPPLPPQPRA